jgi:hypothetical protein
MKNIFTAFLHILFQYLTFNYLHKFEELNCACALDIRRNIAKSMLSILWLVVVGKLIFKDIPASVNFFICLFGIIFDFVFVSYIFKIKNCSCKNVNQQMITNVFYYYWLLIFFSIILIITLYILYLPIDFINKK